MSEPIIQVIDHNFTNPNKIGDVDLVPWAHGIEEDMPKTVGRIATLMADQPTQISIDSVPPQSLKLKESVKISHLAKYNPGAVNLLLNIPNLEGQILLGSDPISFMIMSQNTMDTDATIYKYAQILAGLAIGSITVEGAMRLATNKFTNVTQPSRREFLRFLGIGIGASIASTAGQFFSSPDRSSEADSIFRKGGNSVDGNYSRLGGIDERTFLDLEKQRFVKEVLGESEVNRKMISVWGNDHFLTDDFETIKNNYGNEQIRNQYIEEGHQWLARILPIARDEYMKNPGASSEFFAEFTRNAYEDITCVSLATIRILSNDMYLEPLKINGSNTFSLI